MEFVTKNPKIDQSPTRNAQTVPRCVISFHILSAAPIFMSVCRPFNFRYSTRDVIWPALAGSRPFFIPAGTRCVYSVFAMHRRTDLWGPDGNTYVFYNNQRELTTLYVPDSFGIRP